MAGMLPGVESARRRRFHSDSPNPSARNFTRRSSFCLYTSNHENLHSSSSFVRNPLSQIYCDEKLGSVAREAKKRLDERLKLHSGNQKSKGFPVSDKDQEIWRAALQLKGKKYLD